jgi:hypothetical protein
MLEWVIMILSVLASITIVDRAAAAGFLNGALTRVFAGSSASIATTSFLYGYTNLDSFINACIDGLIGFPGYLFILALLFTAGVWVSNLWTENQAII